MTQNINEAMGRLESFSKSIRSTVGVSADLKALLSYTKQCREALEAIAIQYSGIPTLEHQNNYKGGFDAGCDWLALKASEALSTQPGERE